MSQAVYIVGVGACSSVGDSAPMTAAAVRAGINRFHEHPFWVDRFGQPAVVAASSYLPLDRMGSGRYLALASPALKEALSPLRDILPARQTLPLLLGLPPPLPGTPISLVEALKAHFKQSVSSILLEAIPCGHSAGVVALVEALHRLRAGEEFCIIGGIDTYLQPERLEWLDKTGKLKSPINRWGFIPGEAAGFCVLASSKAVRHYRLEPLGTVISAAISKEAHQETSGALFTGQALTLAMKEALSALPTGARIHNLVGDLNGERNRVDDYGFTALRLAQHFIAPSSIHTAADCWGDIGAASAPLFLGLTTMWGMRGHGRGPLALLWTSSDDGTRGAAVVEVSRSAEPRSSWE
jgi:3-oxoacyl-[acyl-carrier-protein] synthase-1